MQNKSLNVGLVKFQALFRGYVVRKELLKAREEYNDCFLSIEGADTATAVNWKSRLRPCLPSFGQKSVEYADHVTGNVEIQQDWNRTRIQNGIACQSNDSVKNTRSLCFGQHGHIEIQQNRVTKTQNEVTNQPANTTQNRASIGLEEDETFGIQQNHDNKSQNEVTNQPVKSKQKCTSIGFEEDVSFGMQQNHDNKSQNEVTNQPVKSKQIEMYRNSETKSQKITNHPAKTKQNGMNHGNVEMLQNYGTESLNGNTNGSGKIEKRQDNDFESRNEKTNEKLDNSQRTVISVPFDKAGNEFEMQQSRVVETRNEIRNRPVENLQHTVPSTSFKEVGNGIEVQRQHNNGAEATNDNKSEEGRQASVTFGGLENAKNTEIRDNVTTTLTDLKEQVQDFDSNLFPVAITAYPKTKPELLKLRQDLAMELLWVQQAIDSRRNYLEMKKNLDA